MKITSVSDCVLNCWVGEVAGISLLELTICEDPNLVAETHTFEFGALPT